MTETTDTTVRSPDVYDHVRPTDDRGDPGIYRVVGTTDADVTLLRVADADGRRHNTGEVLTVSRTDLEDFETAENPDGNRPVLVKLAGAIVALAWSVRAFVGSLASQPLSATVALALVVVGLLGEGIVPAPPAVLTGTTVVGALLLAYLARPSGA